MQFVVCPRPEMQTLIHLDDPYQLTAHISIQTLLSAQ
jgi:hypothetical protein